MLHVCVAGDGAEGRVHALVHQLLWPHTHMCMHACGLHLEPCVSLCAREALRSPTTPKWLGGDMVHSGCSNPEFDVRERHVPCIVLGDVCAMAAQIKFEEGTVSSPEIVRNPEFPPTATLLGRSIDLTSLRVGTCSLGAVLAPSRH